MRTSKETETLIRNSVVRTNEQRDQAIVDELLGLLEKTQEQPSAPTWPGVWRRAMKNRITKLVAAVVFIGLLVTAVYFAGSLGGSSVVWADVVQRVEQVQAFTYRMHMSMSGSMMPDVPAIDQEMETIVTISAEYGMKMATSVPGQGSQEIYVLAAENAVITIMPEMKKHMRMEFNDEMAADLRKQTNDPRFFLGQFTQFDHMELPPDTINGIEVEGIETTDPRVGGGMFDSIVARVWVDVENGWPVLMEMDITTNDEQMKMHMVMDDFQWNLQIAPSEFEPVIPDDYTEMANIQIPKMDDEAAVEGLSKFAEITGRYPHELNPMKMAQELARDKMRAEEHLRNTGGHKERDEDGEVPKDEIMEQVMQEFMPVQMLGVFYATLVQQDKDPAYYGQTVGPDDVDAVLLRWKIDQDEYRVIYGDLSVETVTAEQLADLEAGMEQFP